QDAGRRCRPPAAQGRSLANKGIRPVTRARGSRADAGARWRSDGVPATGFIFWKATLAQGHRARDAVDVWAAAPRYRDGGRRHSALTLPPLRTLLVDDEALARDRLRALLRGEATVEIIGECASGTEALAAIHRDHPDLVFLDVQMPDGDGLAVVNELPGEARP